MYATGMQYPGLLWHLIVLFAGSGSCVFAYAQIPCGQLLPAALSVGDCGRADNGGPRVRDRVEGDIQSSLSPVDRRYIHSKPGRG